MVMHIYKYIYIYIHIRICMYVGVYLHRFWLISMGSCMRGAPTRLGLFGRKEGGIWSNATSALGFTKPMENLKSFCLP